jgi:hypothetical protein
MRTNLHILQSMTSVPQPADHGFRGSIRSRHWQRLSHGLYVPRDSRQLTVDLAAWQLLLSESACFASLTSAELRGWWLPSPVAHPVFVSVPSDAPHPQRAELCVTRHPRPIDSEMINGIRTASAVETLLALARYLHLLDLIILGDSALHFGDCTIDQLSSTAAQRRRGAPRLRMAIPLLDRRSESPWESVCDCCTSPQASRWSRRRRSTTSGDASLPGLTCGLPGSVGSMSTTGEKHRERGIHRADLTRERRLVEINVQRVGFTSPQLLHEAGSIIAGLDRLLGRTWDPRRLARWEALLDHSLLRPSGRAEAIGRWRRPV